MKKNIADVIIFTDGASSGNPGPGGWGAIVAERGRGVVEIGGGVLATTNNRMELTAAIEALEKNTHRTGSAVVYTDSTYLRDGIERWVPVWQKRGWKTTAKTEVLNQDLWQKLSVLVAQYERVGSIAWRLVAGHENVPANERVDVIATAYAARKQPKLFSGSYATYPIDLTPFADIDALNQKLLGLDRPGRTQKSTKRTSSAKAYSYVSMVGGVIATHATWAECSSRVTGVSGARFKKALSSEDEKNIIATFKSL